MRAFTLVELSIVLVILGLLVGGVLAGQSLIRAAELRAVIREFDANQVALATFRDKYFALPGDMKNATDYWTAMSTNEATCKTMASYTATCNGNGDGIAGSTGPTWQEPWRAAQHLAFAGLIEGRYNGDINGGVNMTQPGVNAQRSKLSRASWVLYGLGNLPDSKFFQPYWFTNVWVYGAPLASEFPWAPAIAPEEAYNVDMKIDDGKPGSGIVFTPRYNSYGLTGCLTNDSSAYRLIEKSVACGLIFNTGV